MGILPEYGLQYCAKSESQINLVNVCTNLKIWRKRGRSWLISQGTLAFNELLILDLTVINTQPCTTPLAPHSHQDLVQKMPSLFLKCSIDLFQWVDPLSCPIPSSHLASPQSLHPITVFVEREPSPLKFLSSKIPSIIAAANWWHISKSHLKTKSKKSPKLLFPIASAKNNSFSCHRYFCISLQL